MPKLQFYSDKVLLSGPKVDGSYRVSFEVGEYQLHNIKELVAITNTHLLITVEREDDERQ